MGVRLCSDCYYLYSCRVRWELLRMITFKKHYFLLTILLLITEILIALYINDKIIRPYIGDYLVVILLYCFIRTFVEVSVLKAAIGVLIFACIVELLQYMNLIAFLGLQDSTLAKMILGHYFEWIDIIAYILGTVTVLLIENIRKLPVR